MKKLWIALFLSLTAGVVYSATPTIKLSDLPLEAASGTGAFDSFPFVDVSSNATHRMLLSDIKNIPALAVVLSSKASTAAPVLTGPAMILGNVDQPQLTVKGNSVQTTDIFDILKSDNTALFRMFNSGAGTFSGALSASNLSGTNTGDVVIGTGNGLSLVGQSLSLQAADATHTGALLTADWNTFNNKQNALTFGSVSSTTSGVTIGNGANSTVGPNVTVNIQNATGVQPGLLTASDWARFDAKQDAGNYVTGTTGDVVSTGPGTVSATIQPGVVSNSKLATMGANTVKANITGSTAAPTDVPFVSTSTASSGVFRDASGNFSAGNITANLLGTATNATNVATTSTSSNASFFPLFVASSTNGNQPASLGTGLSFNPSTNSLTTTTFVGALSGNATTATSATSATTATTATNATNVATTSTSSNASFFPLFVASSTNGNQAANLGTGLSFNPSTNSLTTTTFVGALSGNATTATSATTATTATSATTATTATNATNVATTATTTNASFFPLFVASSTNGNQAASLKTGFTFNPSTSALTATTFVGALTGTASGNTTYTPNNHGVVVSGSGNPMTVIAPDASTTKVLTSGGASADPSWQTIPTATSLTFFYTNSVGTSVANTGSTTLVFANQVYDNNSLNGSAVFNGVSTFTAPFAGKFYCTCAFKFSSATYVGGNEIILTLNKNGSVWTTLKYFQVQASQNSTYGDNAGAPVLLATNDTVSCSISNNRTTGATTLNGTSADNYFECHYIGP